MLSVALADVDDLDSEFHAKVGKVLGSNETLELTSPLRILKRLLLDDLLRDVDHAKLDEMRDETRVGTVLKNSGRAIVGAPFGHTTLKLFVTMVKGELANIRVRSILVRIVDFKGSVDVEDLVLTAPVEKGDRGDLVGQVDQEVTRAEVAVEDGDEVVVVDFLENELDTKLKGALDLVALIENVEDSDVGHGHVNEARKHGEDALGEGTTSDEETRE